jgi:thiol-disulfide isomerase/thioredoxin
MRAMRKRLLPGLGLLLLVFVVTACGGRGDSPSAQSAVTISLDAFPAGPGRGFPTVTAEGDAKPGDMRTGGLAPDFRLTLADGSSLTLGSLRGRPVVINHWATWCGPCRLEMPEIVRAAQAHEDLVVIGANFLEAQETMAPFVVQYAMEFPVTVDPDGVLSDLYSARGLPMTIFIDREGVVSTVWAGILTPDKLDELLAEIL